MEKYINKQTKSFYMKEEQSIFLDVFGASPKLKVMDFLIIAIDIEYSMKEIAEKSGVGYSTLKLFWQDMIDNKIVVHTRKIGNAKMFKINMKNPIVKDFDTFYWKVTKRLSKY